MKNEEYKSLLMQCLYGELMESENKMNHAQTDLERYYYSGYSSAIEKAIKSAEAEFNCYRCGDTYPKLERYVEKSREYLVCPKCYRILTKRFDEIDKK